MIRDLLYRFGCWVYGHDWQSPDDWWALNTEWDGSGYGLPVYPRIRPLISRCLLCGKQEARSESERAALRRLDNELKRLSEARRASA